MEEKTKPKTAQTEAEKADIPMLVSDLKPGLVVVDYVCTNPKCRARDHGKFWEDADPIAVWINCWKCGAGRKIPPQKMAENHIGMRVVERVDESGQATVVSIGVKGAH